MIPPDLKPFIDGLVIRTGEGLVNWVEAVASRRSYEYVYDFIVMELDYKIAIGTVSTNDGDGVKVEVLNSDGKVALSIVAMEKDGADHHLLTTLYESARRRALKADVILKSLMSKLEKNIAIGLPPPPPPPKPTKKEVNEEKDASRADDDLPF